MPTYAVLTLAIVALSPQVIGKTMMRAVNSRFFCLLLVVELVVSRQYEDVESELDSCGHVTCKGLRAPNMLNRQVTNEDFA